MQPSTSPIFWSVMLHVSDISTMGETRVVEDPTAPRIGKFAGAQQALLRQATVSDEERVSGWL